MIVVASLVLALRLARVDSSLPPLENFLPKEMHKHFSPLRSTEDVPSVYVVTDLFEFRDEYDRNFEAYRDDQMNSLCWELEGKGFPTAHVLDADRNLAARCEGHQWGPKDEPLRPARRKKMPAIPNFFNDRLKKHFTPQASGVPDPALLVVTDLWDIDGASDEYKRALLNEVCWAAENRGYASAHVLDQSDRIVARCSGHEFTVEVD